jgi:hypothetical protein
MKRYSYTKIGKDKDNNRVYKPTLYPVIKIDDRDIFIITRGGGGDRLDLLANKYYSDVSLWWVIAVANDITKATFTVKPGIELRIPSDIPKILSDLEQINKGF